MQARIFPALIAGLPTLALLLVLVPWNYLGLPHLIATTIGVVLLFAFADVGRRAGKLIQEKLKTDATPEQWHHGNSDIPETAKSRYRSFIEKKISLTAPTAEEEGANPSQANDFYLSANNWLREHTRDTRAFSILFKENITYGYRRNLLGLKPLALMANFVVGLICWAVFAFQPGYFIDIPNVKEKIIVILAAVLLHSIYMLVAVDESSVREASRTYGRQLILCCESLASSQKSRTTRKKGVNN